MIKQKNNQENVEFVNVDREILFTSEKVLSRENKSSQFAELIKKKYQELLNSLNISFNVYSGSTEMTNLRTNRDVTILKKEKLKKLKNIYCEEIFSTNIKDFGYKLNENIKNEIELLNENGNNSQNFLKLELPEILIDEWNYSNYMVVNDAFYITEIKEYHDCFWRLKLKQEIDDEEIYNLIDLEYIVQIYALDKYIYINKETIPNTPREILATNIFKYRIGNILGSRIPDLQLFNYTILSSFGNEKKFDVNSIIKEFVERAKKNNILLVFVPLNVPEQFPQRTTGNYNYNDNEFVGFEINWLDQNKNEVKKKVYAGCGSFIVFDCFRMRNLSLKYIEKERPLDFICFEFKKITLNSKFFKRKNFIDNQSY